MSRTDTRHFTGRFLLALLLVPVGTAVGAYGIASQQQAAQLAGTLGIVAGFAAATLSREIQSLPGAGRFMFWLVAIWPTSVLATYYVIYWHTGSCRQGWCSIEYAIDALMVGSVIAAVWGLLLRPLWMSFWTGQ